MDWEIENEEEKRVVKPYLYEFFASFKDYITEFYRESVTELCISEIGVQGTVQLFDGLTQGKVKIKNQGKTVCYLSTAQRGGYRLDPGETVEFFVNNTVVATTLSGVSASLGLIKS